MGRKCLKSRADAEATALVEQAIVEFAAGAQTAINSLLIGRGIGRATKSWRESRRICHGRRVCHVPKPAQPKHASIARRDGLEPKSSGRIIPGC